MNPKAGPSGSPDTGAGASLPETSHPLEEASRGLSALEPLLQTVRETGRLAVWRSHLALMSPAYFGLVMATGIVSLSAHLLGHARLAAWLLELNGLQYFLLCLFFGARAWLFPRAFFGDMVSHRKGPGYFTAVAGTGILATQCLIQLDSLVMGSVLAALAAVLWLGLTYTIFMAFTIKAQKPALEEGITGGWLLATVATQSLAVVAILLAQSAPGQWRLALEFASLSMWLWGGVLYLWVMLLILYRYVFFQFTPDDLTPTYWINMGAMAISTLAGSLLILHASGDSFLAGLVPFLKGVTLLYWAAGTWWIPLLVLFGIWRHLVERVPLRYDPLYWGLVFPLGMYAASTWQMGRALAFDFLDGLAKIFFMLAVMAWLAAFAGLLHRLIRIARVSGALVASRTGDKS